MRAILLVSHGSRSPQTKSELTRLVEILKHKSGVPIIECAFLEIEHPSIPEGIKLCVDNGAKEVLILLNFLNAGQHVDRDIPKIVSEAKTNYPQVKFKVSLPLGQHPKISDLLLNMIEPS